MGNLYDELVPTGAPRTLLDKASDLSLLLTKIEEKLGTTYVDSEGHFALLASQIPHSELLKGADIYIDGFENFTTREYEIVTELMKHANRIRSCYRWKVRLQDSQIMNCFSIRSGHR